jgi:hypothetical protein
VLATAPLVQSHCLQLDVARITRRSVSFFLRGPACILRCLPALIAESARGDGVQVRSAPPDLPCTTIGADAMALDLLAGADSRTLVRYSVLDISKSRDYIFGATSLG